MRPRAAASSSSRPSGTDGFDHPYRMTVDNRYKKAAEKKIQLHKLLIAQAAFLVLKTIPVILLAMKGEHITSAAIASCLFGGLAVLLGTVGLRRSSPGFLNAFIFCASGAVILSILPFLSGYVYGKVFQSLETFHAANNFKPLLMDGLEVAQEFVGIVVQLLQILVTLSLLQYLSRKIR